MPLVDGRPAGDGERVDHRKYLGLCGCQRSSFKPVPEQASSVSRCAGTGQSFSSLYAAQYWENMRIVGLKGPSVSLIPVGWGYSWRIARKVHIVRTFLGSGCRGGLGGRLLHTFLEHANRFSSFPPDSVLDPGFWNISCGFILYHRKEFQCVSSAPRHQDYWACQAKIPRGYWWHAVRAGSSMGASAVGIAQDEWQEVVGVLQWKKDPPGHALRGVPGMGSRLVVRCAHTADINSECFSCLGSWSF